MSTEEERYLWHTNQMEAGLLGAALVFPESVETVSEIVSAEDFRDPVFGQIWRLLEDLVDTGVNVTPKILLGESAKRGLSEQFGAVEYYKLVNSNGITTHLQYYAEEVARLSAHRKMVWAATLIKESEFDVDFDPRKRFAEFEAKSQSAIVDPSDGVWLADAVGKAIAKQKVAATTEQELAIPTQFRDLDAVIGGYYPGHVVMIAARSFMGKTTLALNMALKLVHRKHNVLFFSLEMTALDLAERALSGVHAVPFSHFNRGIVSVSTIERLEAEAKIFNDWKMKIYQRPRQSVRQIRAAAKLHKAVHGLDVIFIDHLQLVAPADTRLQRNERLLDNADRIKELAKELDVTVVLLNQLNAGADGEEPDDTHLSGSKEVITSVDSMVYLHRPTKTSRETLLKITKARKAGEGGGQGRVALEFDGSIQWFRDCRQQDLI